MFVLITAHEEEEIHVPVVIVSGLGFVSVLSGVLGGLEGPGQSGQEW